MVKPFAVKMFFDGAPDSYTALLLDDYEGRPGFRGQTNLPVEQYEEEILAFNRQGVGVSSFTYSATPAAANSPAYSRGCGTRSARTGRCCTSPTRG